ncbi:acetyl-CoA C-acetyltransferase [Blastococcus sp. Marseille-P5729]|uniref:acetyl-CoA C-acetyltransferase n=1 Tax=Blastococcus sp. Marseille-P5729 TaxID=2086582 RepID=UPI000D0FB24F|nr:acetyl-CoA C-acetyltransferase [Blastococcus sp. Marseille-P5729]
MESVVICNPVRTAIGGFKGVFTPLQAPEIATQALKGLMERTGLKEGQVDDVILGQCYPNGESPAIGRIAALDAGLGIETGGWQLDRRCGSGLQAVLNAVMQVAMGVDETIVAGGAGAMTNAEFYALGLRPGGKGEKLELVDRLMRGRVTAGGKTFPVEGGMIETAENLRAEYRVSREEQDEFAYQSQMKAAAAIKEGKFAEEIVPITLPATRKTPERQITEDEHPRPEPTVESLAKLTPIRGKLDPESTVTAGNSSGQNDAASMCVVTTEANAAELGLTPMVKLVGWAHAGVPPKTMGIGPVPAVAKLFERTGLSWKDIDLIELNEAFAAQALACLKEWGISGDDERLNVNGSGISLGHPVGATGTRILTTMAYEMKRRGARYGLETMCIGGGQGLAAIFERVDA